MKRRTAASLLSLSAAALVALVTAEGFVSDAMIPTKGDVRTLGFGSTTYEDGTRVQPGDTIEPVRALQLAHNHLTAEEKRFRDSIPDVPLHQAEYDVYMDFIYQYGMGNWRNSSMRRHLLAGNYRQACDALLLYKYAGGYDCSTMINGSPNKRCWGVWTRQLDRHAKCLEADK